MLVLSAYLEHLRGIEVMRAGASGYVGKESADADLVSAIRRVACGGKYIGPAFAEKLAEELAAGADHMPQTLSEREAQVTRLLAAGKPNSEISHQLCLSISAVSTYRARSLRKLKLTNNAELVRYAVEMFGA